MPEQQYDDLDTLKKVVKLLDRHDKKTKRRIITYLMERYEGEVGNPFAHVIGGPKLPTVSAGQMFDDIRKTQREQERASEDVQKGEAQDSPADTREEKSA